MGLGLHGGGLGVTRWLRRQGAQVTVTDLRSAETLAPTIAQLNDPEIEFVLGEHREADFANTDLVIRNPGVPRESRFLQIARERRYSHSHGVGAVYRTAAVGNGAGHRDNRDERQDDDDIDDGRDFESGESQDCRCGKFTGSALELLDTIDAETPVLLEMSSFQLEEFQDLRTSPHIAALTNVYPDHLNRYRDLDNYTWTKAQIFLHQSPRDQIILNFDNSLCTRLRPRRLGR